MGKSPELSGFNSTQGASLDLIQAQIKQEKLEGDIDLDSSRADLSNGLFFDGVSFGMNEDNTVVTSLKKQSVRQTKTKAKMKCAVKNKGKINYNHFKCRILISKLHLLF